MKRKNATVRKPRPYEISGVRRTITPQIKAICPSANTKLFTSVTQRRTEAVIWKNKNWFRAITAQSPANMALWIRVQFVPMYAHNSRRWRHWIQKENGWNLQSAICENAVGNASPYCTLSRQLLLSLTDVITYTFLSSLIVLKMFFGLSNVIFCNKNS